MKTGTLLGAVAGAGIASVAYARFARPRVLNWQTRADEAGRAMPGDEIFPEAELQTTRATTIDAPPEYIWPWLVQMGPKPRAGAYTYDWIERLLGIDIENSDRILPEYQHLEVGDFMGINEKGYGLSVCSAEPGRFLVLQWVPAKSTWAFGLYPEGGGMTRLVSRNRLRVRGPIQRLFMAAFMEPGSLVMERKMLLGIRERAERLYRGKVERCLY